MEDQSNAARGPAWWVLGGWAGAVIIAATLAVQAFDRQLNSLSSAHPTDINDFNRWLLLLPKLLFKHMAIHNTRWPMPPVTILLLSPFSLLSFPSAQFVWVLMKLLLVAVILYCGLGMIRRAGGRITALPLLLAILAWMWPVIGDMQEGQMNLLMLAPMMLGLWLVQREDPLGDALGGLSLALAVCIKVTPIIFLIYLLWRRRWRAGAAMAVGIVLWLYLPLTIAVGWPQAVLWNQQYLRVMILPYIFQGAVKVPQGESLPSFLLRLICHVPAFTTYHQGVHKNYFVNVLALSRPVAERLIRAVLVVIGGLGLFWMRRRLPSLRCPRYVLEIGAVAAFMLWAEEWAWVPDYVTLILTLLATAMIVADPSVRKAAARRATWALIAAAVLMLLTSDIVKIFGPHAANYGRTADPALFAGILLVLAILTAGGARRPEAVAQEETLAMNPERMRLTGGRK